jgi:5-methylthioadenosine/S-adenosylhomocysteine deaminase
MADVQIQHATIVTMNQAGDVISNGTVCITDGAITYVGHGETAPPPGAGCEILSLPNRLLIPGLVNAHTHLPMSLFRGLADDLPLHEWLEDHIFPAEAAFIDADTIGPATQLSVAEMLLSGTTTCADGYFLEEHVLQAAASMGIRGVFGHGVIDFRAPGIPDPERKMEVLRRYLEGNNPGALQTRAIFPHAVYTCSAETLRQAKQLADDAGCRFFIHIAETAFERQQCIDDHGGLSPIRYLDALGLLDRNTILVHAVHVDDEECDLIAERGAAVVINTESNMKLASGIAPVAAYVDRRIPLALGTDGCASNNDLDMFSEMSLTAKLQKLACDDPAALPAETVLRMATIGGAAVLGLDDRIGSVETGKRADLVAVRTDVPHAAPMYDPVSHIVYAAGAADVDTVLVDGKILVRDGLLLCADVQQICHSAESIAERIRACDRR